MSISSSHQSNSLKFSHVTIREKLDKDQRAAFQAAITKHINHYKRIAPVEAAERKLSNHQILREMKSLLTHLNHVCAASGPESKFQHHFWGQYIGWKASDDDRKVIAGFPRMVELMRRIVSDSITSEAYKIVRPATETSLIVAMQAAQLLRQFGIKPTITIGGAWLKLTKYMLLHGYGRDEDAENIRNYLKRVRGYFYDKNGG